MGYLQHMQDQAKEIKGARMVGPNIITLRAQEFPLKFCKGSVLFNLIGKYPNACFPSFIYVVPANVVANKWYAH